MKPLILHARASNFFGGPEKQILGHIGTSREASHCVLAFTKADVPNELLNRCRASDVRTVAFEARHSFDPSLLPKLISTVRRLHPHIICTYGYKPAILLGLTRSLFRCPLIMFARGHTEENPKVRFYESMERLAMRVADLVVAVSEGYARHLVAAGVPLQRIRVVHNAVHTPGIALEPQIANGKRAELGFSIEDQIIATAGRLSPEKAQADLIRAFAGVTAEFPRAKLLILGEGPLRSTLEDLAKKTCSSRISFLGFRKDIGDIMSAIDLFVLPSHTEGLPNVVLEAFSHGKPVVATGVGGVPELVVDGLNGFLVPPAQPDHLSEAILRSLRNRDDAQRMGNAGYLKVKSEFTFTSQTRQLESIYAQLLRNGTGA